MSSSEAVMVSPEQCATAPKTITKGLASSESRSSSTRLVLLAVLALAAATGAMFGVVVFGNEFTKDVHPKGSTHMNSVTLVDSNDRAIATSDVESYVSLLDLPLLGTAELNKVDGITFSTFKGIEHRKVTGYTITKETAKVGDSVVETPRLSLRSEPGVTIEVSVRDSKAWVSQTQDDSTATTAIDVAPQRRLADAGSCLGNGACLYSRDELLTLDTESRRLTEGSFFARADVAAYQVDLNGENVMQQIGDGRGVSHFEGKYTDDDGSFMMIRLQRTPSSTQLYVVNHTAGMSRLMTANGTFLFDGDVLVKCSAVSPRAMSDMEKWDFDDMKKMAGVDFKHAVSTHGREIVEGFVPHVDLSTDDCTKFNMYKSNHSIIEGVMGGMPLTQQRSGNALRRMMASRRLTHEEKVAIHREEKLAMMQDMTNERNQQLKEWHEGNRQKRALRDTRRLEKEYGNWTAPGADSEIWEDYLDNFDYYPYLTTFGRGPNDGVTTASGGSVDSATFVTHFDLWIATRLADPTFVNEEYENLDYSDFTQDLLGMGSSNDINTYFKASDFLNMAGSSGVSASFVYWTGMKHANYRYLPRGVVAGVNALTDGTLMSFATAKASNPSDYSSHEDWASNPVYGWGVSSSMTELTGDLAEKFIEYDEEKYAKEFEDAMQEDVRRLKRGRKLSISLDDDFYDIASTMLSKSWYHAMFPGACSGGYDHYSQDAVALMDLATDAMDIQDTLGMQFGFNHQYSHDMCVYIRDEGITSIFGDYTERAGASNYNEGSTDNLFTVFQVLCDKAVQYPENPALEVGGFKITDMNSWASVLMKDVDGPYKVAADGTVSGNTAEAEYIVAFQGTKSTDLSMLQYNLRQTPIFTYIGSSAVVIPVGYHDYMNGLVECLDMIVDDYKPKDKDGNAAAIHTTFITGHSLGGAAATLYAKSRSAWNPTSNQDTATYPRLVTFGAAPTSFKGETPGNPDKNSDYRKMHLKCVPPTYHANAPNPTADDYGYEFMGWCDYSSTKEGMYFKPNKFETEYYDNGAGSFCQRASPQSVRFAHKFDPIPSVALWKGQYGHSVKHVGMIMDKYDDSCTNNAGGCMLTSATPKAGVNYATELGWESNPYLSAEWLCTKLDIQTNIWVSACDNQYSSYMTMLTPDPCSQISLMRRYRDFMSGDSIVNDIVGLDQGDVNKFTQAFMGGHRGYVSICSIDGEMNCEFISLYALQFALWEEIETIGLCYQDWVATMESYVQPAIVDYWLTFGFLFTFSMVHSTYGFYPLCIGENGARTSSGGSPDSYFGSIYSSGNNPYTGRELSCSEAQMTNLYNFCARGEYAYWGGCVSCGIANTETAADGSDQTCQPCCMAHMGWEQNLNDAWSAGCAASAEEDDAVVNPYTVGE